MSRMSYIVANLSLVISMVCDRNKRNLRNAR